MFFICEFLYRGVGEAHFSVKMFYSDCNLNWQVLQAIFTVFLPEMS